MMRWRISIVAALALFAAAACDADLPTAAENEVELTPPSMKVVVNDKVAFPWTEWNACAGEWMDAQGRMHFVIHETYDKAGGVHMKFHMQPMGMKAVGRSSGMVCQGNGPTQEMIRFVPDYGLPVHYTWKQQYLWICPGPNNNATAHNEWRVRVNANGDLTVWVENARSECLPN